MIEINLLPPQYRAVERTPLPVFLGLLAGIALIGGAVVLMLMTVRESQQLKETKESAQVRLDAAITASQEFDALQKKINGAQGRIDTVLNIGESRMPWSIKLEQFVQIMPQDVWIDGLDFARRPDGSGDMRFKVNARGTALKTVTEFKHTLRSSTNFYYHFDRINVREVIVKKSPPGYADPEYLSFEMVLPLRQVEVGGEAK